MSKTKFHVHPAKPVPKSAPKPINKFTVKADIYEVRPDKPLPPKTKEPNYKVFLGGGITKCPNWQKKVIEHAEKNWEIPTVIWNPRCEVFNVKDPKASDKQVAWEYERLCKADTITFWFDKATLCPIVLFELGSALWRSLGKGTELVIGCDPKYERLFDVQKQVALFNKTNKTKHKVLVGFDKFLKAL
jgi:hypothetical protein